jgi:hypothetical protein
VIADIVTDANQPLPLASDGPYEVIGVSLSDVAPTMPIPEISDLRYKHLRNSFVLLCKQIFQHKKQQIGYAALSQKRN